MGCQCKRSSHNLAQDTNERLIGNVTVLFLWIEWGRERDPSGEGIMAAGFVRVNTEITEPFPCPWCACGVTMRITSTRPQTNTLKHTQDHMAFTWRTLLGNALTSVYGDRSMHMRTADMCAVETSNAPWFREDLEGGDDHHAREAVGEGCASPYCASKKRELSKKRKLSIKHRSHAKIKFTLVKIMHDTQHTHTTLIK